MTIPSNTGLETALRGLMAAQAAIDTTGQNIANANNPNYTRQRVNLVESAALTIPAFSNTTGAGVQLGTGVDAATISRIRDQFLDIQYRAQNSAASNLSTSTGLLQQVQTALAEPGAGGISSQLTAFWNAWSDLANSPSSLAAKQGVVDAAKTLTDTFNSIESNLQTLQSQASTEFTTLTGAGGQIQSDADQIAQLNGQIGRAMNSGQSPNDLLDRRDQLVDDLSQYATVSVNDDPNLKGQIQVSFGGNQLLVDGTTSNPVSGLTITPASGGTLGALQNLSSASGPISGYLSQLQSFAQSLVSGVNGIHPGFFSLTTSTTTLGAAATSLGVAVSASGVLATAPGNPAGANDIAQGVAALAGGSIDQSYSGFVSLVGSDVQSSQNNSTTQNSLLTAIGNQRQSVSGVSLDEEMTNLVSFQRAYQASARMMTTIDATLDTLINRTGTVGL